MSSKQRIQHPWQWFIVFCLVNACGQKDPLSQNPPLVSDNPPIAPKITHNHATQPEPYLEINVNEPAPELHPVDACFAHIHGNGAEGANYTQYDPVIGTHCLGTNHQDIQNVERIVFLGDSVTVGTPPTETNDFYRVRLAIKLATLFDIDIPPFWEWEPWKGADIINGTSWVKEAGAFANCSKWGARTDDLMQDKNQVTDCMPANKRDKRTLVIITMGGNDLKKIAEEGFNGAPFAETKAMVDEAMALQREAIEWIKDPVNFPNGSYVVFANVYEYTDATGDTSSCQAAELFEDLDGEWPDDEAIYIHWMEETVRTAVETGTDMIFLLEHFCGHGFRNDDPNGQCYRGPNTERWLDLSCTHPNPTGHENIADMFYQTIAE